MPTPTQAPPARRGRERDAKTKEPERNPEWTTRFTDADLSEARDQISRAFALAGLVDGGNLVCPCCGTAKKDKVVVREDKHYWKCFRCGAPFNSDDEKRRFGDAIALLKDRGWHFVDAVNALLGRPVKRQGTRKLIRPDEIEIPDAKPSFTATLDPEVYDAVLAGGERGEAVRFFGRFHIDPDVVAEAGAVVVTDPARLVETLESTFGRERLVACGLVKILDDGRPWPMLNRDYPVVEPHRRPDGHAVGLQFRAGYGQERRIAAHKAGKGKYFPKHLSLVGGTPDHLVGCGLARIASLEPGNDIYVVEGFKDMLAARTMGAEAYAVPGVGVMPPAKVCRILARHQAVICLDGDAAGEAGAQVMAAHFDAHGVGWRTKALPDGLDVTDVLVRRNADSGCRCRTCQAWRSAHPET